MSGRQWSGKGWTIALDARQVSISSEAGTTMIPADEAGVLHTRRRWFRWYLFNGNHELLALRGASSSEARALAQALRQLVLTPAIVIAHDWHKAVTGRIARGVSEQRWISSEAVDALVASRPEPGLAAQVRAAGCEGGLSPEALEAVRFADSADVAQMAAAANEQIMVTELASNRQFFDRIEKSPLTDEQARVVVCFDNRVQVIAAAGSGKTSVMVARAAYAATRGFVPPQKILLLAFNKNAAEELRERITARFSAAGIDSTGVRAATFHAFGLDVIGKATGEKPRLAPWLDNGGELRKVMEIVDQLRDRDEIFRYNWDLYRLVFANTSPDLEDDTPDGYDPATATTGHRTFGGDLVRSKGEKQIADFLFLSGVRYSYERPYAANVADATHSQYRPDFYYPDIDVWHEHWAVDRHGRIPASFRGYAEGMAWKRQTHAKYGTTLIETTFGEVMEGDGLRKLQHELESRGVVFDWNPDRPRNDDWAKPMEHEDLARLVRTFMTHLKSNSWGPHDIEERLGSDKSTLNGYRTRLFLEVFWPIHAEWERCLRESGTVDFEDMLVQAAGYLENGTVSYPYELLMVDEFQDASRARARLVRGLVRNPGRYLLTVGDDWQSINRFAGADLSVMTQFEAWFGRGQQLALTTTFRCPQVICDVAASFVAKNPSQFTKPMRSSQADPGPPVTVIPSQNDAAELRSFLDKLSAEVAAGTVTTGTDGTVSVDVLGRYNFQRDIVPRRTPTNLRVTFRTVHGSKGLEADYIVVPSMSAGSYGFPSTVADDPVLGLAMPAPETFKHAEERRLFYVALTRAGRQVVLLAPPNQMSPFVVELLESPNVMVDGVAGASVKVCSGCGQGTMVPRKNSKTGKPFFGCSTFPACTHTQPA